MLALSHAPREVREDALQTVERFVILMYTTGPVNALTLTRPTQKLFADIKQIPPTKTALEQQGGQIWGQALLAFPVLPLPTSWGWKKTEGGLYEPNWTTLPEAAQACYELVSCKCKKGCVGYCKYNLSVQLCVHVRGSVHRIDL